MFKAVYILLLFIVITSNITTGQEWPRIYGDNIHAIVEDLCEDYDKGYLISGSILKDAATFKYGWVIKTDINGTILWDKKFGNGLYQNYFIDFDKTIDGGMVLSGATSEQDVEIDPLFIKLNSCGEIEWCRIFLSEGYNCARGIISLPDGGFIGMMNYYGGYPSNLRISLVKMDAAGEPLWIKHLAQEDSTIHNEEGYYLDLMTDGNYLVTGRCFCGGLKPFWIKIDTSGEQLWDLKWPEGSGFANQTAINSNGILYNSSGLSMPGKPITATLLKFDSNGNVIDQFPILGDTLEASGIRPLCFYGNSSLLVGIQWRVSPNYEEGFSELFHIDTNGIVLQRRLLIDENRPPKNIIKTFDNKILVSGYYVVDNNWDIYLWKLNSDLQDDTLYTQSFTYDSLCPYPITSDTVDLNCSLFVYIDEIPTKEEYENNIRFYPNPASEIVTLSYAEQNSNKETLIYVYNSFGILVKKIRIPDRKNQHTIDISSFPSGLYIAVLRNERKIIAKGKFIIAR